jgi:hypothetical protein
VNSLPYFLRYKDRKLNEDLVLVDYELVSTTDDYLHTKGLGLYKQGKYKEALEILQ